MKTTTFSAMGSSILIALDTDDDALAEEARQARGWFEAWESSLSRFRNDSEVCRLNRNAGKTLPVSETLLNVLSLALEVEEHTGGLVTPAILNALEAAGYTNTFEELDIRADMVFHIPLDIDINTDHLSIDREASTVFIPYNVQLDFGGVAKGWAAHQAMLRLQQFAPVLVDAGGDIAVSGERQDGSAWSIGIADPFEPERTLDLVQLRRGGIATSGRDYRRWQRNGRWQHHLIDPRTGHPADTDILSATVIAGDVMAAEEAAKTGLILGSASGSEWLEQQKDLEYYLVLEDRQIIKSKNFDRYLWKELCPQIHPS